MAERGSYSVDTLMVRNPIGSPTRRAEAMNRTAMSLRKMWLDANGTWVGENPHGAKALGACRLPESDGAGFYSFVFD